MYSYTTTGTDDSEKINASSVKYNGSTSLSSSYSYDDNGNVLTKSYGENTSITNTYDSKDRITSTTYAGKTTNYTYDSNDQLLSANDDTYAYDSRGNITSKTESGTTTTFTYSNSGWKDQLVSVNGVDLTYDANGNVLTYGDKEYTWNSGRNLESITDGDNTYSYTYDENGIRTSKEVGGVTTYFNTKDGVILSQTDGTNTMYFQYDTSGSPLGFVHCHNHNYIFICKMATIKKLRFRINNNVCIFLYIIKFKTILKRTNDPTIICCICALFGEFGRKRGKFRI